MLIILLMGVDNVWAGEETQNGKQYNVVYLKSGASGNGDSSGSPVGTWANAYKKLTNTGDPNYDWEHNIIVIVGSMQINYKEGDTKDVSNKQGTAATITGVWPWDAEDNAIPDNIKNGGKGQINSISCNIGANTRFRNLCIQGSSNADQNRISLRLHSALFDEGLVMIDFKTLGDSYGMIGDRNAPALHIQLSFDHDGSARPSDVKYEMSDNKEMTVTFKSGRYGRVAVSRAQGTSEAAVRANYIQGTPEKPVMAHIIVDIQDGNDNSSNYKDDIGILLGGSSQGIVCADLQFDIKRGSIGTLVAGAQGNNIAAGNTAGMTIESWKIPQGTFAGRTIINLESNDVTIQNLYVGTQGRTQSVGANGTAYFYGQATLNMRGGTIEKGVFASAAAFCGLGNDTYHTPDYAVPYVDNNNALTFSAYDNSKKMGVVKSSFNGDIDLSKTVFTLNIYGGTIRGGLCGGSRGYDSYVKVKYAPAGAGSFYGDTNVNVYGGTIEGGVYGGGLGDSNYYEDTSSDGGKPGFLTVAQVFGNTNVNIFGGNITGGIYGGGKGVDATSKNEYLDISKVFGNTNVVIDPRIPDDFDTPNPDWTYTGNIYGGGKMGAVEGNTNVKILGGIILGNVFGGGQGEEGHPNKAKVTGTTKVIIGDE